MIRKLYLVTQNFSKSDTPSELSVESNTMSGTVVDNIIKETNALDMNASIDRKRNSESAGKEVTKETSKMPKFCGDVRDYAIFRAYFKHAIEVRFWKFPPIRDGEDSVIWCILWNDATIRWKKSICQVI